MTTVIVVALVVGLAAVVMSFARRRTRQDDGMHSFRRHIDALSPEARREVADRARRLDERRQQVPHTPGPDLMIRRRGGVDDASGSTSSATGTAGDADGGGADGA